LDTQKAHSYAKPNLLSHSTSKIRCELGPVACSKKYGRKTKRAITITKKVYISPTWRDAPLEAIATKLGNSLYLTEVINYSKLCVDLFSSFGSGEVQNLTFAIGTTTCPYHCSATALARDVGCSIRYRYR